MSEYTVETVIKSTHIMYHVVCRGRRVISDLPSKRTAIRVALALDVEYNIGYTNGVGDVGAAYHRGYKDGYEDGYRGE